jgi:hypothetical protein
MKIKLELRRAEDSTPEFYYTNLFVMTEWERLTRRSPADLATKWFTSDWACMMHVILKLKGEKLPDDWREWVKQNPDIYIMPAGDETDPNPTDAAPTAAN